MSVVFSKLQNSYADVPSQLGNQCGTSSPNRTKPHQQTRQVGSQLISDMRLCLVVFTFSCRSAQRAQRHVRTSSVGSSGDWDSSDGNSRQRSENGRASRTTVRVGNRAEAFQSSLAKLQKQLDLAQNQLVVVKAILKQLNFVFAVQAQSMERSDPSFVMWGLYWIQQPGSGFGSSSRKRSRPRGHRRHSKRNFRVGVWR